MHQYKLDLELYTEDGSPTGQHTTVYADSAEDLHQKYKKYKAIHHTLEDGSQGFSMYKVTTYVAGFIELENPEAFFAVFEV